MKMKTGNSYRCIANGEERSKRIAASPEVRTSFDFRTSSKQPEASYE
ncbi:MAG TPA: hypothetical protein VI603_18215 [Saprospiraceae bacterium]|nr:hypothetical protein [Saprospiraceae bacterium]